MRLIGSAVSTFTVAIAVLGVSGLLAFLFPRARPIRYVALFSAGGVLASLAMIVYALWRIQA